MYFLLVWLVPWVTVCYGLTVCIEKKKKKKKNGKKVRKRKTRSKTKSRSKTNSKDSKGPMKLSGPPPPLPKAPPPAERGVAATSDPNYQTLCNISDVFTEKK